MSNFLLKIHSFEFQIIPENHPFIRPVRQIQRVLTTSLDLANRLYDIIFGHKSAFFVWLFSLFCHETFKTRYVMVFESCFLCWSFSLLVLLLHYDITTAFLLSFTDESQFIELTSGIANCCFLHEEVAEHVVHTNRINTHNQWEESRGVKAANLRHRG